VQTQQVTVIVAFAVSLVMAVVFIAMKVLRVGPW
jgi:hypothetical protein